MVFRVYVEKKPGFDVEAQQLGTELKTILGIDGLRKVRIVNGKRKGRFELEFYGQEDLQRLYDALLALGKTEEKPECLN